MRFTAHYPMPATDLPPPSELGRSIASFARAAEAAGFDGMALTEHPAPSGKWLTRGGHSSFDPYVALAYCAAVTEQLKLITHLSVLPYRPPLMTAKAAISYAAEQLRLVRAPLFGTILNDIEPKSYSSYDGAYRYYGVPALKAYGEQYAVVADSRRE